MAAGRKYFCTMMDADSGFLPLSFTLGKALPLLAWMSPASFLLFLASALLAGVFPFRQRDLYGFVEWAEMVFGTTVAIAAIALMIARWRSQLSAGHKTLAITGFCLWLMFWVLTFAVPHGGG